MGPMKTSVDSLQSFCCSHTFIFKVHHKMYRNKQSKKNRYVAPNAKLAKGFNNQGADQTADLHYCLYIQRAGIKEVKKVTKHNSFLCLVKNWHLIKVHTIYIQLNTSCKI